MKVVLQTHVKGLGQKGEVVDVSEGYFRNALLPKNLAVIASEKAVQHIQVQKAKAVEKLQAMEESAKSIFQKINGKSIQLKEKTHDGDKLYAAIHDREISTALQAQLKVEVPHKNIVIEENIKSVGQHKVKVKLSSSLLATIHVEVSSV